MRQLVKCQKSNIIIFLKNKKTLIVESYKSITTNTNTIYFNNIIIIYI